MSGQFYFKPEALLQFRKREDFQVLFILFSKLDDRNQALVNEAELAKELKRKPVRVSQALQRLTEAGAITERSEVEGNSLYTLSYDFVWKDTPKNRTRVETRERMKAARITGIVKSPTERQEAKSNPNRLATRPKRES